MDYICYLAPIFLLLLIAFLGVLGALWRPFSTLIGIVAYKSELKPARYAVVGFVIIVLILPSLCTLANSIGLENRADWTWYYNVYFEVILVAMLVIAQLGFLGIAWSPFSALICGILANKKGLNPVVHAMAGLGASLLFLLPSLYILTRLLGVAVPRKTVVVAYALVFAAWLVIIGPSIEYTIEGTGVLKLTGLEKLTRQDTGELKLFLLVSPPILTFAFWAVSLWKVHRLKAMEGGHEEASAEAVLPSLGYLTPFFLLHASIIVTFISWILLLALHGR